MFDGDGAGTTPGAVPGGWRTSGPAPVAVEVLPAGRSVVLQTRVSWAGMGAHLAGRTKASGREDAAIAPREEDAVVAQGADGVATDARRTNGAEPGAFMALAAAVEMVRVARGLPWWDEAPGLSAVAPEHSWVRSADAVVEAGLTSPAARVLEATRPGPVLAEKLVRTSVADADDAAVVEMVAGWERVAAWAAARQARAVSELAARRRRPRNGSFTARGAVVEVEARLGTTLHAAERKVALAAALEEFPLVADAMDAGVVGVRKADVLCFEEPGLTGDERRAVLAEVVPEAEWLTVPQLRERMRAAAQRANVATARRRHAKEHEARRVCLEPGSEAMTWVSAYLRADHAEAVRAVVDALADAAKGPKDERTVDQRRADAFADVFNGLLERGAGPDGAPLPRRHGRRAAVQVTVASGTLLGLDDEPAVLGGYGPIPAHLAREIAQDGTWRAMFTDAATGEFVALGTRAYRPGAELTRTVLARDVTCTFPGCRMPAPRCEIDHIPGYDAALAQAVVQTRVEDLHTACHTHHDGKSHGTWRVARDPATGITTWTARSGHTYRRPPITPPGPPPTGRAAPERGHTPGITGIPRSDGQDPATSARSAPPGPARRRPGAESDDDPPPF